MVIIFAFIVLLTFHLASTTENGNIIWLPFLKSVLITCLVIALSTELLSLFEAVNFKTLLFFWIAAFVILLAITLKNGNYKLITNIEKPYVSFEGVLLSIICTISFLVGFKTFPNNWDSMVYHLARIPNWMQQGSVNHYATEITRSISQNPFAEYFILHLAILTKNNVYSFFLVQFLAFVVCVISSSYLVKILNGNKKQQAFAAILTATLPMAILQSNTTQNDLVAAMFLMLVAVFIFKLSKNFRHFPDQFYFAVSVALLVLTKGTSFIYLLPFSLFYAYLAFKNFNGRSFQFAAMVIAILIGVNFFHWQRNDKTFNAPLGPNYDLLVKQQYLLCFASNSLNNATLQFQFPFLPEKIIVKYFQKIQEKLNLNTSVCNWEASPGLNFIQFRFNEDYISNPFHFVLIIVLALIFLLKKGKPPNQKILFLLLFGMAFTFCFVLKWQVWHPRLHLPIFVLANTFIALQINNRVVTKFITVTFFGFAIITLYKNELKPLQDFKIFRFTKNEQAFIIKKEYKLIFEEIGSVLNNTNKIAIINSPASWEFPFWYFLNNNFDKEIRSVMVENESNQYKKQDFVPEMIISQRKKYNKQNMLTYKGLGFKKIYAKNKVVIFKQAGE